MNLFKEAILEPPARRARFRKVLYHLPKQKCVLLDLGSGPVGEFGQLFGERIKRYIALDPLLVVGAKKNWQLIRKKISKKIGLPSASVDIIVSTAFVEHVEHPKQILGEAMRILKKGGKLILTTPTPRAKTFLEFLAFRLGWISRREIAEHKNYFDREALLAMLAGLKVRRVWHEYFELGLNNLLVVEK